MHLSSLPLFDEVLAADSTQRRGLIVALVDYLQHRQTSTGVSVNQLAQLTKSRAATNKRRHTEALERLARIDDRLSRLDAQVDELRWLTETLRGPTRHGTSTTRDAIPQLQTLLRIEHLATEIGDGSALADISFDLYEGEILGLVGPDNAARGALLECLAGRRARIAGTVLRGNQTPPAWDPRDLLFSVPHSLRPYADCSTLELLEHSGRIHAVASGRWEQIVRRDLGLGPVLGKRVGALSRSNRQRLLLALAAMSPLPLIALDEPFDGLDPYQTRAMMGCLRAQCRQSRTLLVSTQQLGEAERLCDRFVLISSGRLVGVGTLAELRVQAGLPMGSLERLLAALA